MSQPRSARNVLTQSLMPHGSSYLPPPPVRPVDEDQDGEGITLILFTVEVPQTSRVSHGEHVNLPTPDNWIAFQI